MGAMTPDEIKTTLDAHRSWLRGKGGKRADLTGADLTGADLTDAYLRDAYLRGADLTGADLTDAYLRDAYLTGADLTGADLTDADLRGAGLTGADLTGATLPDGRTLEQWQADPLAGLCTEPEAISRAVAAWGEHSWEACPMHAAHGWGGFADVPQDKALLVGAFVALFDGRHLPKPEVAA